jgi:hypothetical protein
MKRVGRRTAAGGCSHETIVLRRTYRHGDPRLTAPGARFVSLESGGHLMLGQMKIVRDQLADFFAERRDRRTERAAS